MGPQPPEVDAGDDQTFSILTPYLKLDATVIDDGQPVPAVLEWTQVSCTDPCGVAIFDPCNIEDPCVTFNVVGTYVLRLTADDTVTAVSDDVTITVELPSCQDVIDDGLLLLADFSGPEGTPDCRIDLYDFAAFAEDWLRCNDPQALNCEDPYF